MSEHTPGPWEMDVRGREGNQDDPWHCAIVGTAIGRHVVIADTLNCSCVFAPDDQRANAHLLAAAPEMREAIWQALGDMAESHCVCEQTKQQLRAALAKAEGRTPP